MTEPTNTLLPFPKNFCWETNGQLAELIKQAESCTEHLKEDSVGYYYFWMLQTLKQNLAKQSTQLSDTTGYYKAMAEVCNFINTLDAMDSIALRKEIYSFCNGKYTPASQEAWRPISEAPRDGSMFLFATRGEKHFSENISIGSWHVGQNTPDYESIYDGWNRFTGVRDANGFYAPHATHWMPLPKPPTKD